MQTKNKKENDVEILERRIVGKCYYTLEQVILKHRALGSDEWIGPISRDVLMVGRVVTVLPYNPETDELVLIEQFRTGAYLAGHNPWQLECVGGLVDEGEDLEEAAHRETLEETGCKILSLEKLFNFMPSTATLKEDVTLYVGRISGAAHGGIYGLGHEGENIRVHVMSAEAAFDLLNAGKIQHSKTIIALLWLMQNRQSLRQKWLPRP